MALKVCRICGKNKELKNILEQGPEMLEKLLICANIQVSIEDVLPNLICQPCNERLDISYNLRKQSEVTGRRLKKKIKNTKPHCKDEQSEEKEGMESGDVFKEEEQCLEVNVISLFHNVQTVTSFSDESAFRETVDKTSHIDGKEFQIIDNQIVTNEACDSMNTYFTLDACPPSTQANNSSSIENYKVEKSSNCLEIQEKCNNPTNDEDFGNSVYESVRNESSLTKESSFIESYSIDLVSSSNSDTEDCEKEKSASLTCPTCLEAFSLKKDYSEHIKQHGKNRYQCIQCCKFFPTRARLLRHAEIHTDTALHQCPYCKNTYRSQYNLQRHLITGHQSGTSKKYSCNICDMNYTRADVLKRHMLLHSDIKNYICTICSQCFKTQDYLYAHVKRHHPTESTENHPNAKEKPYECETCKKKFGTIAALTTHDRVHSDYRPYQCDVCLKSFKNNSSLLDHKMLHSDVEASDSCSQKVNEFTCALCSKAYSRMWMLKRHVSKIHGRNVDNCAVISENPEPDLSIDITEDTTESEHYEYINDFSDNDIQDDVVEIFEDNQLENLASSNIQISYWDTNADIDFLDDDNEVVEEFIEDDEMILNSEFS